MELEVESRYWTCHGASYALLKSDVAEVGCVMLCYISSVTLRGLYWSLGTYVAVLSWVREISCCTAVVREDDRVGERKKSVNLTATDTRFQTTNGECLFANIQGLARDAQRQFWRAFSDVRKISKRDSVGR